MCKYKVKNSLCVAFAWTLLTVWALLTASPFIKLLIDYLSDKETLGTFGGLNFDVIVGPWLSMWGIFIAIIGVYQVQKRISQQSKQLGIQNQQFDCQMQQMNNQQTQWEIEKELNKEQIRASRLTAVITFLESSTESVRIGGIMSLFDHAKQYSLDRELICDILCAHIRSKCNVAQKSKLTETPSEVKIILKILFKSGEDIFGKNRKNLTKVYLVGQNFMKCKINNTDFGGGKFDRCVFNNKTEITNSFLANMEINDSSFLYSKLSNVKFYKSGLTKTKFRETRLYNTKFSEALLKECTFRETAIVSVDFRKTIIRDNTVFRRLSACRNLTFMETELFNVTLFCDPNTKDRISKEFKDLEGSHSIRCEENVIRICKNE